MALEADIKAAITQALPRQVGEALQQRLTDGAAAEQKLLSVQDQLTNARAERDNERARRERAEAALLQHGELSNRELDVARREKAATVFELKANLAAQERVNQLQSDILRGLVRNTEYRQTLSESKNVVMPGSGGSSSYLNTVCDTKTTTSEAQ